MAGLEGTPLHGTSSAAAARPTATVAARPTATAGPPQAASTGRGSGGGSAQAGHGVEEEEEDGVVFSLSVYERVERVLQAYKRNILGSGGRIPPETLRVYR